MVNTRAQIKKTRQHSGTLIGSSDDLLIEIILRLPVTSVVRFKSVSKHWQWLLSHPPFTHLYKNHSISIGLFVRDFYVPFDVENPRPPNFPKLDFYPEKRGIKIIQSCNGLLLCCSNYSYQRERKYFVFNPTTNQFDLIPSEGGGDVRRKISFMGLAFHQTDCAHYKLVCFLHVKRDVHRFQIQIYSSETGEWKVLDQSLSAPYFTNFRVGVYWNQAFHWLSSGDNQWYLKLDTEELKSLPLPVGLQSYLAHNPRYFGESRGHLHLVNGYANFLHMNAYEMLNDHSGWFLKYRVELNQLLSVYPEMILIGTDPAMPLYYDYYVLDLVRGEEEDETFMAIRIKRKILSRYLI